MKKMKRAYRPLVYIPIHFVKFYPLRLVVGILLIIPIIISCTIYGLADWVCYTIPKGFKRFSEEIMEFFYDLKTGDWS